MVFKSGQYTQIPLLCSSIPIHLPSLTRFPNLFPFSNRTHIFSPHSQTLERSGFLPVTASQGVFPSRAIPCYLKQHSPILGENVKVATCEVYHYASAVIV